MSARSRSAHHRVRQLRRRFHLESLEKRLMLTADVEGDSLASALSVSLTRGAIYQHQTTIGDGDYPTGDVDLYAVPMQAGQHLSIVAETQSLDEGGALSSSLDTYLRLFDTAGNQLASNDYGTNPFTGISSADAALNFDASSAGTYYVGVSAFDNTNYDPTTEGSGLGNSSNTGDYRLELLLSNNAQLSMPTGLTYNNPGPTEVDLSWSAVSGATSYTVERSLDNTTGWEPIGTVSDGSTSYTDTNASGGTNYYYRIQASNDDSVSPYSSFVSVRTPNAAPDGLTVTPVSGGQIDLTWTNHASTITTTYFYTSTDGTSWSLGGSIDGNVDSYSAKGPFDGSTTYYFRIRSDTWPWGYTPYSTVQSVTTPAFPNQPTLNSVTAPSETSVSVAWTGVATATGYRIERSGDNATTWTTAGTVNGATSSFTDIGLTEATSYTYRVIATNEDGDSAPTNTRSVITPLAAPSNLLATDVSADQIDLSWTNHSSVVSTYYIEQSTNGTDWTVVSPALAATPTTYSTSGPFNGSSTYDYRVRAYAVINSVGVFSNYTPIASVTTPAFPDQPANLQASSQSDSSINLSWTDVASESGYRIERLVDGAWTTMDSVAANVTTYTDTGLGEGTSYSYRVVATNAIGDSAPSAMQTVTTPPAAPSDLIGTVTGPGQIHLSWTDHSSVADTYHIQQLIVFGSNSFWSDIASVPGTSANSYTVNGNFSNGTSYQFLVWCTTPNSYSSYVTTSVTMTSVPDQPTVTSAAAQSDTSVKLIWNDDASETGYRVEKLVSSSWTSVGTVAANVTTYTDTGLTEATSYSYRVVATNAIGDSTPSAMQTVTTSPAAPSDLTVTAVSATGIDLAWTDASAAATDYYIEQSTNGTNWTQIGSIANASASVFVATGPFDGSTTYYFRARDSGSGIGYSTYSATASTLTAAFPNPPVLSSITAISDTTVTLTWVDEADEDDYLIQRLESGTWTSVGTTAADATSFTDTGLSEITGYTYRVLASNAIGDSAPSATRVVTTLAAAPSGLTATVVSQSQISLAWTNTTLASIDYFDIEQSTDGTTWSQIGTLYNSAATSFTATGPFDGSTNYQFRVRGYANDSGVFSGYSPLASVTTPGYPGQPNITLATAQSDSAITLNWSNVANESGYRIERLVGGIWTTVGTPAADVTTFTDTGLSEATNHTYRVTATSSVGDSQPSAALGATTLPAAPSDLTASVASQTLINLAWTNHSSVASYYYVEKSTDGSTWQQIASLYASSTYTVTGSFNSSATYHYRVRDSGLGLGYSNYATTSVTTPAFPGQPTLTTAAAQSGSTIALTWNNVANETGYRIERLIGGFWTSVGTVAADTTTFIDTGLAESTSYTYRVTATSSVGDSQPSATLTASTLPAAPSDLTASVVSWNQINLAWNDHSSVASWYYVEKSTDGQTWQQIGSLSGSATHTYTVTGLFNSTTTYYYRVRDWASGSGYSTYATTSVTTPAFSPVARNDTFTVTHDRTLNTSPSNGLLANDTSPSDAPLTVTLVTGVSHGTLTLDSDGSFVYTPTSGYSGSDSFTYQASDGILVSDIATATITVSEHLPTASDDEYQIGHDHTLSVSSPTGVLANDHEVDGDPLTAMLASGPQHGTLTLNANGSFNYNPDTGYFGTDSFTYEASDGLGLSNLATVSLNVNESEPVSVDDAYSIGHDHSLNVTASGVLSSDTDADLDSLTAVLITDVQHGAISLNADGTFTYTPGSGYWGTDTFTYQASDGLLQGNIATVTITVQESAPVANNLVFSSGHDRTLTVIAPLGILARSTDADQDSLTGTLISDVTHGTLTLNIDGSFTYTPDAGFSGTDTFTYQVSDGLLSSQIATVTLNVAQSAPIATDDTYAIAHDQTLTTSNLSGVIANDTDADDDPITASLADNVQYGTLSFQTDGSFTYIPNAGFVGTDSFTYQDSDGQLTSAPATVTISITERAPVATSDLYTVAQDQTLSLSPATQGVSGILFNDTDADGDSLTASSVTDVQHGTLSLNADGTFTYTPDAGYSGTDCFTYQDSDGTLTSNTATVTISVVPDTPVARPETFTVSHDRTFTARGLGVLANDNDPAGRSLTASLITDVQHGTLTLNADGTLTYTPNAGYVGADSFTYQAVAGSHSSSAVTVSINVVETAPTAVADSYRVVPDTSLSVTATATSTIAGVLANDTDPEGDNLVASLVSNVQHGTLSLNADGSFTYTPATDFTGTDTFTYEASDGLLTSSAATVTIDVAPLGPVAVDDQYNIVPNKTYSNTIDGVLANDTDSSDSADVLTALLISDVQYGTLSLNSDGTFTYTPAVGFVGDDSFTYSASNGVQTSDPATVTITIVATAATSLDDYYSTTVGQTLLVSIDEGLQANDDDPSGTVLTTTLVSTPSRGTVALQTNGLFTYTPWYNYPGTDTFSYIDTSGALSSNIATVTITILSALDGIGSSNSGSETTSGSPIIDTLLGYESASASPGVPGLVPFASSALGMNSSILTPPDSAPVSSITTAAPGDAGKSLGNGETFAAGFAGLQPNPSLDSTNSSNSSIIGFFGPTFHGMGSLATDSSNSLFHGAGSLEPSLVDSNLLPANVAALGLRYNTNTKYDDFYGNGFGFYPMGGPLAYGQGFYRGVGWGYNSLGYTSVGWNLGGAGADFFNTGGSLSWGNDNDGGSLLYDGNLTGGSWDYDAVSTVTYNYEQDSTTYTGTFFDSVHWSETWDGHTVTESLTYTYSGEGEAITDTTVSTSTGWIESQSTVTSSLSETYGETSTAPQIPGSWHDAGYPGFLGLLPNEALPSTWSWFQTLSETDSLTSSQISYMESSAGHASSSVSASWLEQVSLSRDGGWGPAFWGSVSYSESGSNWASSHEETADSFSYGSDQASDFDNGTETTTYDSTQNQEFSGVEQSSINDSSPSHPSSHYLSYWSSGSNEFSSHAEGTDSYHHSSFPSDAEQDSGTVLASYLESTGAESFAADSGASSSYSGNTETVSTQTTDSHSTTSSGFTLINGSGYANATLQGNDSFTGTILEPSSSDIATDQGAEQYMQSKNSTVSFTELSSYLYDSALASTPGMFTVSHFDSGRDDTSVDIRGYDAFNASSSDPSFGETDTDTGSENYHRNLASSDSYKDKSVYFRGSDKDGFWAEASLYSKHVDDGSVEGSNSVQGNDTVFTLVTDSSAGEIDTDQTTNHYREGADSSISFNNGAFSDTFAATSSSSISSFSHSHSDTGNDSSYFNNQSDETATDTVIEPSTGDQSGWTNQDHEAKVSSSTLKYSDQNVFDVFAYGTSSTTSLTDLSHSDSGSDSDSYSDSGTDTAWDFYAQGGSDSDAASYSVRDVSSDQYDDYLSNSTTIADSTTFSSATSSETTSSTETYTSTGDDTSCVYSDDVVPPVLTSSSYSLQETYENQDNSQSDSTSFHTIDSDYISSSTLSITATDSGSEHDTIIDWSSIDETDAYPDEAGDMLPGEYNRACMIQSGDDSQFGDQTSVFQETGPWQSGWNVISATSFTSGSDSETQTESVSENDSYVVDGVSPWQFNTRNETSSETFSDNYNDETDVADGSIDFATSSTSDTDTSYDSTSLHEEYGETLDSPMGTTVHTVTSDDNSIDHASNLSEYYSEDDDGVLNGWNITTQSSTTSDTLTSFDIGSFWDSASGDFGIEAFTGTLNGMSSLNQYDLDWMSSSFNFEDGVTTGLMASDDVESITQTASESTQGSDSFSQIGADSLSYTGTGTFSEIETDWTSSTSHYSAGYSFDASGDETGGEHWTDVSEELQADIRHDVDDLADQNGSTEAVTLDASSLGTTWSNGSDQTGTTLTRSETWTQTDTDGLSTYTETDTDTTTDVFADSYSAPTSSGTPTSTQVGQDLAPFLAAQMIAINQFDTVGNNEGGASSGSGGSSSGGSSQSDAASQMMMAYAAPLDNGSTSTTEAVGSRTIIYDGWSARLQKDYVGNGQYAVFYVDLGWRNDGPPVYVGQLDKNTGLVTWDGISIPLETITAELTGNGWDADSIANFFSEYASTYGNLATGGGSSTLSSEMADALAVPSHPGSDFNRLEFIIDIDVMRPGLLQWWFQQEQGQVHWINASWAYPVAGDGFWSSRVEENPNIVYIDSSLSEADAAAAFINSIETFFNNTSLRGKWQQARILGEEPLLQGEALAAIQQGNFQEGAGISAEIAMAYAKMIYGAGVGSEAAITVYEITEERDYSGLAVPGMVAVGWFWKNAKKYAVAVPQLPGPAPLKALPAPNNSNRGIMWTTERTGRQSAVAKAYEDSLTGASSDLATRRRNVPALRYDNPNPAGNNFARFDGVDPTNPNILIDRKWGVTTRSAQVMKFQNTLEALRQNPDFRLRIEVPTQRAATDARRLLRYATGSSNPHPQISIVVVP